MNKFYTKPDVMSEENDIKEVFDEWNKPLDEHWYANLKRAYVDCSYEINLTTVMTRIADFVVDPDWFAKFYERSFHEGRKVIMRKIGFEYINDHYFEGLNLIIETFLQFPHPNATYELIIDIDEDEETVEISVQIVVCVDIEIMRLGIFVVDVEGNKITRDDIFPYIRDYIKKHIKMSSVTEYSGKRNNLVASENARIMIKKRIRKAINKGHFSCVIWRSSGKEFLSVKEIQNLLECGNTILLTSLPTIAAGSIYIIELLFVTDDNIKPGKIYLKPVLDDTIKEISLTELIDKIEPSIRVIDRI